MNSFSQITTEIKENVPFANIELETVSPKVRVGMEGRKNAAKARIAELKKQLSEVVWDNAVFIVPMNYKTQEALEQFVSLADAVGECMPVNYQYWDEKVGKGWWDANGNKPQNIDTIHTIQLLDEVRKTANDLQLNEVATPSVPRQIFLNSQEECVHVVKSIVTAACGLDFRLALLKKEVADVAEKLEWGGGDSQPIPFVLTNVSQEDFDMLSKSGKSFFKVGLSGVSEMTEEFVQKTLEKIAKQNKKSK